MPNNLVGKGTIPPDIKGAVQKMIDGQLRKPGLNASPHQRHQFTTSRIAIRERQWRLAKSLKVLVAAAATSLSVDSTDS